MSEFLYRKAELEDFMGNPCIEALKAPREPDQVIQDLIYNDLKPDEKNCQNIVNGMIEYVSSPNETKHESKLKQKVFSIFMDRLSGLFLHHPDLYCIRG